MVDFNEASSLDPTILTALKLLTPEMLVKYSDWLAPEDETNGDSMLDILERVIVPVLHRVKEIENEDSETFNREMTLKLQTCIKRGDPGRMERLARVIDKLHHIVMEEMLKQIEEDMDRA